MIKSLSISNFKSIKELKNIDCKKVNIFLGEPNTGKSNILEAISILGLNGDRNIRDFIRFENYNNLFFRGFIDNRISISTDIEFCSCYFENDRFIIDLEMNKPNSTINKNGFKQIYYKNELQGFEVESFSEYYFYKYSEKLNYNNSKDLSAILMPPSGENLLNLFNSYSGVNNLVSEILDEFGFEVFSDTNGFKLLQKNINSNKLMPYSLLSDTIKRIVFYETILYTLKGHRSTILLEEPETHTMPSYISRLAHNIAKDQTNQFFIVTHNPYLLQTLIQKTNINELQVNILYVENFETKIHQITSEKDIEMMIEMQDILFFNLHKFINP